MELDYALAELQREWSFGMQAAADVSSRKAGQTLAGRGFDNAAEQIDRHAGFLQGLEKRGWSEDRNLHIDYRFALAGTQAQVLAKELVALQPDAIFAMPTPAVAALQRESHEIPIVFAALADPVGSGFIASLARPGGNITGVMQYEPSVTGKWLAMLKEIAPSPHACRFHDQPQDRAVL